MPYRPEDFYNPNPRVAPLTESGNDYAGVRANPGQFGQQIAEAEGQAGSQDEQLGNSSNQLAIQKQQLINESLSNNADLQLAKVGGEIFGKFRSLQGFDAATQKDAYTQQLQDVTERIRNNLPNAMAQRSFDMLATRRLALWMPDMDAYASAQLKEANINSVNGQIEADRQQFASPAVANNPYALGQQIGSLKHDLVSLYQKKGYSKQISVDPITGQVQFSNDTLGDQVKAMYNAQLNKELDVSFKSTFQYLAYNSQDGSMLKANEWLQKNQHLMPANTFAELSHVAQPIVRANAADNMSNSIISQWTSKYNTSIGEGRLNILEGKLGTPDIKGLENTPQGVISKGGTEMTANGLEHFGGGAASPYQITPIGAKEVGYDWNKIASDPVYAQKASQAILNKIQSVPILSNDKVAQAVAYHNGISFAENWVRNGESLQQLGPMTQKYVARLFEFNHSSEFLIPPQANIKPPFVSQTDYLQSHMSDIVNQAGEEYLQHFPGDIAGYDRAKEVTEQKIRTIIQQQQGEGKVLQDQLMHYIRQNHVTSISEITGPTADPKLRESYDRMVSINGFFGQSLIDRSIYAEVRGYGTTYGTSFYKLFSQAATGKVNDLKFLSPYMNSGGGPVDNDPLTPLGLRVLEPIMQQYSDLKTRPQVEQMMHFISTLHDENTGANLFPDIHSAVLEQQFNKGLVRMIPALEDGLKAGKTFQELTDPKSKDYVGNLIQAPSLRQIQEAVASSALASVGITNPTQKQELTTEHIEQMYRSGKLGVFGSQSAIQKAKDLLAQVKGMGQAAPEAPIPEFDNNANR
jgi:hypothetical protein